MKRDKEQRWHSNALATPLKPGKMCMKGELTIPSKSKAKAATANQHYVCAPKSEVSTSACYCFAMQEPSLSRRLLAITLASPLAFASFVTIKAPVSRAYAKEKVHQWQKGMLIDVASRDASRLTEGTSHERSYWTYSIDDGKYVWKLQRDMIRRDKPLVVTVNTQVDFAIEGQKAFLKDESGKDHEMSVQTKILKVAQ